MYEVKIPLLVESVEAAQTVIRGVQTGEMDPATATRVLSGARVLQAAVAIDARARLLAPRIAAQEAKLVEHRRNKELEKSDSPESKIARAMADHPR